MKLPSLKIRGKEVPVPVIQGGMGIGLSKYTLAGAVAREGGIGVLSSAGLDRQLRSRHGQPFTARKAAAQDVRDAKEISGPNGLIGMNIMVAVINQYKASVLGSMDGGVDVIISGAGLPMKLPEIAIEHPRADEVALIPIVSSGRALDLICRRWQRSGRLPDAVIVEGPLAGGHIGWKSVEEAMKPEYKLEKLIAEVLPVAKKWGNPPVIAAGGVYSHEDIVKYIDMGCAGVQMGTRFLATEESGASPDYKRSLVESKKEDIILAERPGSPCGMPFHVITSSPFYQEAVARTRAPKCDKGYLLNKGYCPSAKENEKTFCICNGLLAAIQLNSGEKELYTVGASGWRVNEITTVAKLMGELKGEPSARVTTGSVHSSPEASL